MSTDDIQKAQGRRLKDARVAAGFATATDAAAALSVSRDTYIQHENGGRGFKGSVEVYARRFKTSPEWLLWGRNPTVRPGMVPIVGLVDANASDELIRAHGQDCGDMAPVPPGGWEHAVAAEVRGHSMGEFAPDGALIYFEEQRLAPTRDMLGHIAVVETTDGKVLVKRLLRGSKPGLFDLESLVGPTLEDQKLRWAALVIAAVPPIIAKRIIVRAGEAA